MATIRIEDEQVSGKGYAMVCVGLPTCAQTKRGAWGRSTVTPDAF